MIGVVAPCAGRATEPLGGTVIPSLFEMFDCVIWKPEALQPFGRLSERTLTVRFVT
jgi:hypothetical protein